MLPTALELELTLRAYAVYVFNQTNRQIELLLFTSLFISVVSFALKWQYAFGFSLSFLLLLILILDFRLSWFIPRPERNRGMRKVDRNEPESPSLCDFHKTPLGFDVVHPSGNLLLPHAWHVKTQAKSLYVFLDNIFFLQNLFMFCASRSRSRGMVGCRNISKRPNKRQVLSN